MSVPPPATKAAPPPSKPTAAPAAPGEPRMLSVAGTSNVKALAGSISHTSRGVGAPPTLQAVGAQSLNQAIKSIAVARTFLEADQVDFEVEVSRIPDDNIRNLLQLKLNKISRAGSTYKPDDCVELRVAGTTETVALAGAISNNIRDGHRVCVTAIGPSPVFRAVDSIVKARQFLQKDSLDIVFVPMFTTIRAEGAEEGGDKRSVVNALQFIISKAS